MAITTQDKQDFIDGLRDDMLIDFPNADQQLIEGIEAFAERVANRVETLIKSASVTVQHDDPAGQTYPVQ